MKVQKYIYLTVAVFSTLCMSAQVGSNVLVWNWNNKISLDFRGDTVVASDFEHHGYSSDNEAEVIARTGSCYTDDSEELQMYVSNGRLFTGRGDTVVNGGRRKQGVSSSHDESLIIKHNSEDTYTVIMRNHWWFDIDVDGTSYGSISYAIVDLSSYPGRVVRRNILISAKGYREREAMRFAAYTHPSGSFTWLVISDHLKQIHVYKVTADTVALHSTYNIKSTSFLTPNWHRFKFSNFGNFIARSYRQDFLWSSKFKEGLMVYKFDKNTGDITGEKFFVSSNNRISWGRFEFSPNEKYIYTGTTHKSYLDTVSLYQTLNPFIAVEEPIEVYSSDTISLNASMQLGPDGRIYMLAEGASSKDSFVSYIASPDIQGTASDFVPKGVKLKHPFGVSGMPSFVQDYITQPYLHADTVCVGGSSTVTFNNNYTDSTFVYAGGSRFRMADKDSFMFAFSDSGHHTMKLICHYPAFVDTMYLDVYVQGILLPTLGSDTLLCTGTELLLELDTIGLDSIHWSTGASTHELLVVREGEYFVSVSNEYCTAEDTIRVEFISCDLHYDSTCFGNETWHVLEDVSIDSIHWGLSEKSQKTIVNKLNHRYATDGWHDIDLTAYKTGLYKKIRDRVYVTSMPQNYLIDSLTLCESQVLLPELAASDYSYLWQDGSDAPFIMADHTGWYILEVEKNRCTTLDSTYVYLDDCKCIVYIPNSFTPNGDQMNDVFQLWTECDIINIQLDIYTRWGEKIVSSDTAWDGTYQANPCQRGVYLWQISYLSNRGKRMFERGTVHLLR